MPFNGSNNVFITRLWASDIVRAFMSVTGTYKELKRINSFSLIVNLLWLKVSLIQILLLVEIPVDLHQVIFSN